MRFLRSLSQGKLSFYVWCMGCFLVACFWRQSGGLSAMMMKGAGVPTSESIQRADNSQAMALPCIANLTPKEAWSLLSENPQAQLIDVRTTPEWMFVGLPDLTSLKKQILTISWRNFPEMNINTSFESALSQALDKFSISKSTPLLFLCKTGGRSAEAAMFMASRGWEECYNIECGFDGEMNASGQRGTINGWKHEELPWRQA